MSPPLFSLSPRAQKEWIKQRLALPTPSVVQGLNDGFRMPGREGFSIPAAVLVPIINRPTGLSLLLTQRNADLPDHPGQISFPGGRAEPQDATLADTALREAVEEIGLSPDRVVILGELASYETVTGYKVTPVVGWLEPPFELKPDPIEVADIFEVPLSFLLDRINHQRHFRLIGDNRVDFWAIPYGERYIWGATAAMLLILDHTLCDIDSAETSRRTL
jgi:8-oxo-dGTP pyrophosphatase MutT (NUDIX family)